MRTDPPTGDELTRMLTTMKTNVLRRADETMNQPAPARRTRTRVIGTTIAIISLIVVGSAGAALATGVIPSPFTTPITTTPSPTPTPTMTPTPTPSPTTSLPPSRPPVPTPTTESPLVNGYDARAVYQACIDATPPEKIYGFGHELTPEGFSDDSVKAGVDPYTQDHVPETEWDSSATVYVNFPTDSTPITNIVTLCSVTGPPESPTVTFIRDLS